MAFQNVYIAASMIGFSETIVADPELTESMKEEIH